MEVIWWKFVINLFLIFGGPGEPYVESRGTKMSWITHHTGDISTTKKTIDNKFFSYVENIDIFGYLGAWGGGEASIIRLGPSWFTSTLSFILICMSNIEAIW